MAVDYLNALNVGSGLQTNDIIDALVEAERAPKANEITTAKDKRTVEISGLGEAAGAKTIVFTMNLKPLVQKPVYL